MKFTRILFKLLTYLSLILIAAAALFAFGRLINARRQAKDRGLHNLRYLLFKSLNTDFFGIWSIPSNPDHSLPVLFHQHRGNACLHFSGDPDEFATSLFTDGITALSLRLQEKFRVSSSSLVLQLLNPIYNKQEEALYFPEQLVYLKYLKSASRLLTKECLVEARAAMSSEPGNDSKLSLEITSVTCPEMNLQLQADPISHDLKTLEVLFHVVFCYLILGAQVYFIAQMDLAISNNLQQAGQVSLISLLILATFQLFNGFEQLVLSAFNFPLWGFIVLIGVAFFNLFFFTILKLMTSVLKGQLALNMAADPGFAVRWYLMKEYLISHATILSAFYYCLEYSDRPTLYFYWTLALLPQIIKNFFCRNRFLAPMKHMAGLYVSLMIFALYQHFFRYNFFFVQTNSGFNENNAMRVVVAVVGVLLVLVWQETCSPHLFFNRIRGKNASSHTYLKSICEIRDAKKIDPAETDCIICLLSLEQDVQGDDWIGGLDNEQLKEFIAENKDKGIMVTPCDHYYHTSCLLAWMGVKMDCPCCRQPLPPII